MLRSVLGAAVLATTGALPVFMLTAQGVLVLDDLGLGEYALGLLVSCFYVVAAVSSIPTGRIIERGDPAVGVRLATGLAAASAVIIALGPTSVWTLVVGLVIGALGNSCSQAAANLVLSVTAPPRHQGLGFGVKQSAMPAASMLGGLVVPTLGVTHGWRWGFALAAAIALTTFVLVPLLALTPTRDTTPPVGAEQLVPATRRGPIVLFAAATACSAIAMSSVLSYFVVWAARSGIGVGVAGTVFAAASLGSVILRVLAGVVADRRGGKNMGTVIAMVIVGVAGALCIATGVPSLILLGAFLSITVSWSWAGLMLFSVARTSTSPVATISILQTGAFTGNAVGPGFFALLISLTSYRVGWLVAACFLGLGAILLVRGRALRLREREEHLAPTPG